MVAGEESVQAVVYNPVGFTCGCTISRRIFVSIVTEESTHGFNAQYYRHYGVYSKTRLKQSTGDQQIYFVINVLCCIK